MDASVFRHLCTLSRLDVGESRQNAAIGQMSRIVDLMDSIRDVEIRELPPNPGLFLGELRMDISNPSLSPQEALANASGVENQCFTVPKIME